MRSPIQVKRPTVSGKEICGHMIYNATFALIFGFFASRTDGDPESCFAAADHDSILAKPAGK